MRTPHTSFYKGTTVFVILREGSQFEDKFVDHKSGCVILEKRGRIRVRDIRAMSIRKLKEFK